MCSAVLVVSSEVVRRAFHLNVGEPRGQVMACGREEEGAAGRREDTCIGACDDEDGDGHSWCLMGTNQERKM